MAKPPIKPKTLPRPPLQRQGAGVANTMTNVDQLKLALKQSVAEAPRLAASVIESDITSLNLLQREIQCARLFNFELPEQVNLAIGMIEHAVLTFTESSRCALLLLDEETGSYRLLNTPVNASVNTNQPIQLSDNFLRQVLDSPQVIQQSLSVQGKLVGIVAIAERTDNRKFEPWDELLLDLMSTYLAPKLIAFHHLKHSVQQDAIQKIILEMSSQLITAVDQEGVLLCTLSSLTPKLGFDLGQYIELNPETGKGQVLVEYQNGETRSYIHAGLESQRKPVEQYLSLISLFQSSARQHRYLHLPGNSLGSTAIKDIFHLEPFKTLPNQTQKKGSQTIIDYNAINATVVMPIIDPVSGEIKGTINLYKTSDTPVEETVFTVTKEMVSLIALTLSRVMVLEKALALASTDELTGLYNRRSFYERFESEIERARRQQTSLCVALIDVDFFKKLNDTYGHLNGDIVLKTLAQCFKDSFRKSDMVCRFGGEEFAILLPDTNLRSATDLMDRIRRKVARLKINSLEDDILKSTCSIGLTQVQTTHHLGEPVADIISKSLAAADEHLYTAKENGRNQVVVDAIAVPV